jgi:tetratricopeptide (TPR) repeat protein
MGVTTYKCTECGAPLAIDQKECEYCGVPVHIERYSSVQSMPMPELSKRVMSYQQALVSEPENKALNTSVGMCFLRLKQYDHALKAFQKAMEFNFDNSEVFFYAAVCMLHGKIPFLHLRPTINQVMSYLDSALMIENRGIYHYLQAYIKLDYFKRKFLNVTPTYAQHLQLAKQAGVTESEIAALFELLGVQRPAGL